jgi:hypothetical protein
MIHEAAIVILNMTGVDVILIVAHHTDDWASVNVVLMLPYHRVDLWSKMILHIRLLENCRISEHKGLHLLHLW